MIDLDLSYMILLYWSMLLLCPIIYFFLSWMDVEFCQMAFYFIYWNEHGLYIFIYDSYVSLTYFQAQKHFCKKYKGNSRSRFSNSASHISLMAKCNWVIKFWVILIFVILMNVSSKLSMAYIIGPRHIPLVYCPEYSKVSGKIENLNDDPVDIWNR